MFQSFTPVRVSNPEHPAFGQVGTTRGDEVTNENAPGPMVPVKLDLADADAPPDLMMVADLTPLV